MKKSSTQMPHNVDMHQATLQPKDPCVLALKEESELFMYRHAFESVAGAVYPITLLSDSERDDISAYARSRISRERTYAGINLMRKPTFEEHFDEPRVFHRLDAPAPKEIPPALIRAGEQLGRLFEIATGQKPQSITLNVNNTFPTDFHTHKFDVMTYTVQGHGTIGKTKEEYHAPLNNAFLMKPEYRHKTSGDISLDTPRLTFVVF